MQGLRSRGSCLLAGALLPLAAPAWAAKAVVELNPSSPWNMHYAEDSCVLARSFGEDKQRIVLRFERTAPGNPFSLTMIGPPLRAASNQTEIRIIFGPRGQADKREQAPSGFAGDKEKVPLVIVESTSLLGPMTTRTLASVALSPEAEQATDSLLIDHRPAKSVYRLKLGPMGAPMKAMRACTDELLGHWGLDPVVQRNLRSLPEPLTNPGGWLRPDDYPKEALGAGKSAVIRFRLTVSETGKASGCAIQSGTRGPDFEKITCSLLIRRASFKPARDQTSNPVASYYTSTVTWIVSS